MTPVRGRWVDTAHQLEFALSLRFFGVEARFPEDAGEIPVPAVAYVAQQPSRPRLGRRTGSTPGHHELGTMRLRGEVMSPPHADRRYVSAHPQNGPYQ